MRRHSCSRVDPQSRTHDRAPGFGDAGSRPQLRALADLEAIIRTPRSLGLVGDDEFTARPLPANFDVDTLRTASYAVSLEPAGGSKSGAPSGPVLFTGKMVESLPGLA